MSFARHLPVLVVLIPLLTAVAIPLLARIRRSFAWMAAAVACSGSLACSVRLVQQVMQVGTVRYQLGNWAAPWGIEYVVDYLDGFVLVVVSFILLAVVLYSPRSVEREIDEHRRTWFYSLYLLLVGGLLGIVVTGDIFNMYVFIEISSLATYALITAGRRREALAACFHYLILGTIGATFILLGIGHLYMATGSLNMADLAVRLGAVGHSGIVLTAFAFFAVGFSLKLALFPLHVWLPNAYTYAPSVVGAALAATSTKVAAYALIRVMFTVFHERLDLEVVPFAKIMLVLACVAIVMGSVLAISQSKLKRMLAYSSVGQIGYIVLGIALLNETALAGAIVHILNHALMKCTLFLVAGIVLYRSGAEDISALDGLGRKIPWTMAAFTAAALSMVGVPLTVGFVSKWYLCVGALQAGHWVVVPVVLLSSLLTVVYFWRLIERIYFGKMPDSRPTMSARWAGTGVAPASMVAPTVVLGALCVVLGIAGTVPAGVAFKAAGMLLGSGG